MRFWWVNQNQTCRQVDGHYLWSPKLRANGTRNPFYEFMREVSPGDLVFSFADTRIRAFGKQILATASQELTAEFGAGFSYTALTRMARFAEWVTDDQLLASLSQELSWSHFIELLPIKDPLARDFYAEMCRIERWDVRTLRLKIGGMLFQRTALSRKPEAVISAEIAKLRAGHMSADLVFRDPYLPARSARIGLKGAYSERDLESASCARSKVCCWNWAPASPSSPDKSA